MSSPSWPPNDHGHTSEQTGAPSQPPTQVHGYPYGALPSTMTAGTGTASAATTAPPLYPAFSAANPARTVPASSSSSAPTASTATWSTTSVAPMSAALAPSQPAAASGSPFQSTPYRPHSQGSVAPTPPSWSSPSATVPAAVAASPATTAPVMNPYTRVPQTQVPPQPPASLPTTTAASTTSRPQPPLAPPHTTGDDDVYVPTHVHLPTELAREDYAEEAVQEAARHWTEAQYRRHLQQQKQQTPFGSGGAVDAAYLQSDALTGAANEMASLLGGEHEGARARESAMDPHTRERMAVLAQRRAAATEAALIFAVRAKPKHQYRLILLLAVTLFGTLPLMSSLSLVVLLAGVVVMYVMDFLNYPRATIFAMLMTVVCFGVAVFLSNFHAAVTKLGPTLLILDLVGVLLVVAAAGLLHFHWIQETYPELICAMERTIMAAAPLLAMPSIFSTSLALSGARYGPVLFFLILCALHYTFYAPLESSFMRVRASPSSETATGTGAGTTAPARDPAQRRARLEDDENPEMKDETRPQQLNGRAEAIFFTLVLLILPSLLYSALQSNWGEHILANMFNLFGFACGGLVYLCIDPARSTWFLSPPTPPQKPTTAGGLDETAKAAMTAEDALLRLAYDPLGLQSLIERQRLTALSSSCVALVLWAAYRLVTSRHAYVFNGLPFPGNLIALALVFYLVLYVLIETMQLMDLDAKGVNVRTPKYLTRRALVVLAAQVAAVALCFISSAPPTFLLPATLSIAAFHLFLLDRTNAGPMIAFTVFSSLMLLWWLYRTFSFLVVDLHVLGEVASVPTPVLSLSVLWMYVLGCITFTLSFSPNKFTLLLFLFMYVTQLTWIEHVLYSQKEDNTYPGVLVLATTAAGVFLAQRLYKNEVLGLSAAAFVAASFLAKIPTFLIEVTSSYYYDEITLARARKAHQLIASQTSPLGADADGTYYTSPHNPRSLGGRPTGVRAPPSAVSSSSTAPTPSPSPAAQAWDRSAKLYAIESSTAWWTALVACYVAALFILEARKRLDVNHAARYIFVYCFCTVIISLCTVRNVQRAVYELITQSYVDAEEVGHIGIGTACATFTLLTMPLLKRLKGKYASAAYAWGVARVTGALSVMLLLVQPTRVIEKHISFLDYEFDYAEYGRWAAAAGLVLLVGGRFLGKARFPLALRAVYWVCVGMAVAFGIVTMLMPVPTVQLFLFVWLFVFSTMLTVDLAHYRRLHAMELYLVYGLSVAGILMAFFALNRVNLERVSRGNASIKWEVHEQGRLQLLAVVMASNLFLSVLLKFRVSGRPLLPGCASLSADGLCGVSVIANYATMLTTCVTCVLNFYANDSEPLLYVISAFFLLMLVDDGELFSALHKEQFRYFPTAVFALAMLWFCSAYHAWRTSIFIPLKIRNVGLTLLCSLFTLPAQASLLRFLYLGRARGGDSVAFVVVTAVLSGFVVVFASQQSVRWMAMLACGGQAWRLFAHRLGAQSGHREPHRTARPGAAGGPRAAGRKTRLV